MFLFYLLSMVTISIQLVTVTERTRTFAYKPYRPGRIKYPMKFDDAKFKKSWHLKRNALAVQRVWQEGYTGKGVVIGVVDHGVETNHPELKGSVLLSLPNSTVFGWHGTACAGVIAARPNNQYCGVGVAFDAKIVSLNTNPAFPRKIDSSQTLEQTFGLQ
ncbi:hypothetical protein ACOME3_004046 [Neoechinorhynchus agilis]